MALEPVSTLPESNKYYTQLRVGPYERKNGAFELSTFDPKLIVRLPLPTELRDDTSVSYTNANLETVGDVFNGRQNMVDAAALRGIGSLTQMAMRATSSGINNVLSGRGAAAGALNAAQGALLGAGQALLPPDQISSAIQQSLGAAPNPNPSVQFQGPVLRSFTLTWAFYPKNLQESREIDKLIRRLKARALPSDNSALGSAILNYPHICQLNFFPWDGIGAADEVNGWTPNSIIKIKKCFMENVNANYHAFGTPAFFEGENKYPVTIQLTISFKEIEYLLSKDWDPDGGLAASERTQAPVTTATVITTAANKVVPALGEIVAGTFTAGKDLLFGEVGGTGQTAADVEDNFTEALNDLTPPVEGQTTPTAVITTPGGLGFNGNNTYTVSENSDGKFVLVEQGASTGGGGDGPRVTPDPVTTVFNSISDVRAYLNGKGVFANGTQTQPPPPAAAAEAPE
jgi:hypothetical protein